MVHLHDDNRSLACCLKAVGFNYFNKLSEAIEIGLYDYLDSGYLCIMEWPENIEEILPEETLKVQITVNPDQSRTVSWES